MFLCLCFVVDAVVAVVHVFVCLRVDIFISFLVITLPFYALVHDDEISPYRFYQMVSLLA